MKTLAYHGIRPFDPEGRIGLANPERGFRTEALVAADAGEKTSVVAHSAGRMGPGYHDDLWVYDARKFQPFGLALAQTYCYLDRFTDRLIPQAKLDRLEETLRLLRRNGLKAVLRFAYEGLNDKNDVGPAPERILRHIGQLEPIIRRHVGVIHVLQAGFVGMWGEWHHSAQKIEESHAALAAIVARLLEALPQSRMTQVRVPVYKCWVLNEAPLGPFREVCAGNAFDGSPAARIGFHNDGFMTDKTDGWTWPEPPNYGSPGNPEFDYWTRECPWLAIDGELFWHDAVGHIDGWQAAVRLRMHHYTSLSLAHSYSQRLGSPYCMDGWMIQPITVEQVKRDRMPLSEGYFDDPQGNVVTRSAFDYIRDHLGYRLELQDAEFPEALRTNGSLSVQVHLINRGFSTPVNPRRVSVVLIDQRDGVIHEFATDGDARKWQPYEPGDDSFTPLAHAVRVSGAPLPKHLKPGFYQVGLWLAAPERSIRLDPRYAIRTSNRDTLWWTNGKGQYGINVFGLVEILR